jgi:hypothetical protein
MLCTSLTSAVKSWLDLLGCCTPQPHLLGILGLYMHVKGGQGITMSKGRHSTAQDDSTAAAVEKLVRSAWCCTPQPHLRGILGLYTHLNGSQGITMSKGRSGTAQDEQQQHIGG